MDGIGGAVSYNIDAYGGPYQDWTTVDTISAPESSPVTYTATVVAGGNSYSFRVAAVDDGGESAFSDPADPVETPNAAPASDYAYANGDPVTGTSTNISASASDDGDNGGNCDNGGSDVSYSWVVASTPDGGDAWFDDATSSGVYVTFTKAGDYSFTGTATDSQGLTDTAEVNVTVDQTLTSIVLSPDAANIAAGGSRRFNVTGIDQFGDEMVTEPTYSWSVASGDGSIDQYGLYTTPSGDSADATCSVSASSGDVVATASVGLRRGGTPVAVAAADSGSLFANDDSSSPPVNIGMQLDLYGTEFSQVYVNNNGNITVAAGTSAYTPSSALMSAYGAIIAPFFADVDTRQDHGTVAYGPTSVGSFAAWEVDWSDVGYYNQHGDLRNTFSLTLVNRSDVYTGDFDIIFSYGSLAWETGDASGGQNGFGGTPARAGYSNGSGVSGTYYELPGSGSHNGVVGMTGQHTYAIRNPEHLTTVALDMTVTDAADSLNHVTAIAEPDGNAAATIPDLYVAADSSGAAYIDLSGVFAMPNLSTSAAAQYVHLSVAPWNSNATTDDTYANLQGDGGLDDIALNTTGGTHDFTIIAWLDADRDTAYTGGIDPRRQIKVHVVSLTSVTVTDSDDATETATTTDSTVPEVTMVEDSNGQLCFSFSIGLSCGNVEAAEKQVSWVLTDPNGKTVAAGWGTDGVVPYKPGTDGIGDDDTFTVEYGRPKPRRTSCAAGENPGRRRGTLVV